MKNIVIKWAVFLTAFLISLELSAQNVRVSGVVTDALGPIPGVNIMEEGTTNGTVTDVNGKYSISVSAKSTLVFSCIGYKEQKNTCRYENGTECEYGGRVENAR